MVRMAYISQSSDFDFYLQGEMLKECQTWDVDSIWHKDWLHNNYQGDLYIWLYGNLTYLHHTVHK